MHLSMSEVWLPMANKVAFGSWHALLLNCPQACDACAAVLEAVHNPGSEQFLVQHLMSIDVLVGIIPQEPG